ncbi:unnamed protein product [Fraxinus pennsylvanica]|uniref:Uncharacterized protein n=1 Tax=Fraxinus pennsylvanica TaxID=56036 RepID=A0AAD1ZHE6_9LAMI|nr:unnamed protein product [Fraxinus pennsylvanica]
MADLEKLLLEAAGRTTTTVRNRHSSPPSRRRRKSSHPDDGSDFKNDDSDDDRGYSNRKPSGSQVPLKKRGRVKAQILGSFAKTVSSMVSKARKYWLKSKKATAPPAATTPPPSSLVQHRVGTLLMRILIGFVDFLSQ